MTLGSCVAILAGRWTDCMPSVSSGAKRGGQVVSSGSEHPALARDELDKVHAFDAARRTHVWYLRRGRVPRLAFLRGDDAAVADCEGDDKRVAGRQRRRLAAPLRKGMLRKRRRRLPWSTRATNEFADLPNQADWDLLVDGHPLQIKEGVDAAHIKEFLTRHPDIQVLTGDDMVGQIHDAHLQGIPELDHDAIASSTKDSLHGVKDGFHPSFHIPIITLLRSPACAGILPFEVFGTERNNPEQIGTKRKSKFFACR